MGREKKKKVEEAKKTIMNVRTMVLILAIGTGVWMSWRNTTTTYDDDDDDRRVVLLRFVSNGASPNEYDVLKHTSNSHVVSCPIEEETKIFDFERFRYYMPNGDRISAANDVCTSSSSSTVHVTRVPNSQHYVWPAPRIGHITNVSLQDGTQIELEVLASSPRILYVHNFLSESEANDLISFAQSDKNPYKMAKSTTGTEMWNHMSEEKRKRAISSQRTSTNAFVLSTPTAMRLKRRAFDMLNLDYDEQLADGIQVLRYDRKQAYIAHTDYFPTTSST